MRPSLGVFLCMTCTAHALPPLPSNTCPSACADSPPSEWTVHNYDDLKNCKEGLIFTPAELDHPDHPRRLRACTPTATGTNTQVCGPPSPSSKIKAVASVQLTGAHNGPDAAAQAAPASLYGAVAAMQSYHERDTCSHGRPVYGYYRGALAGVYLGDAFDPMSLAALSEALLSKIKRGAGTWTAQVCGDGGGPTLSFGFVVNTSGNVTAVREAVETWTRGGCWGGYEMEERVDVVVWETAEKPGALGSAGADGSGKVGWWKWCLGFGRGG
ncbi:hypothetical protein B0H67DRAFT_640765 [Lasiosphaeris hirsuta]|uniref:Uncharacterized protein n=1 Tax=Lasiosphaeris hirsuta TaxID=260670 RepID=A0AA40AY89_9PEZI|nr:hypothetical protein B0H67DRAFT_640765 [Lasiosphaeris hirsuta]